MCKALTRLHWWPKGRIQFSKKLSGSWNCKKKHVADQPRLSELSEGKSWFLSINKERCVISVPLEIYWLINISNALLYLNHHNWKRTLPLLSFYTPWKQNKRDFPHFSYFQLACANSKIEKYKKKNHFRKCYDQTQFRILDQQNWRISGQMKHPIVQPLVIKRHHCLMLYKNTQMFPWMWGK